jgi:hypothetical protein
MALFNWLFRKAASASPAPKRRRYEYPTGNIEFAIRVNGGEPLAKVLEEIGAKWMPGNEHLWDEYDIESLIDTEEKRSHVVNRLLYARVSIYRTLRARGNDIRGQDPFGCRGGAPEEVHRLEVRFPELFPGAFEGKLPPMQFKAIELPNREEELEGYLRSRE